MSSILPPSIHGRARDRAPQLALPGTLFARTNATNTPSTTLLRAGARPGVQAAISSEKSLPHSSSSDFHPKPA